MYGDWTTTSAPTENESGTRKRICDVCKYEQVELIEKIAHEHGFETKWTNDKINHWHDSTCIHKVTNDKGGHTYSDWEITLEPTSLEEGSRKRVCSVCEYIDVEVIEKLEHKHLYSRLWTTNEYEHYHAAACGHDVSYNREKHVFGDWFVTVNPSETHGGERVKTCSTCKYSLREETPSLQHRHNLIKVDAFEGNCHKEGIVKHYHCTICDENFVDILAAEKIDNVIVRLKDHTMVGDTCSVCKGTIQPLEYTESKDKDGKVVSYEVKKGINKEFTGTLIIEKSHNGLPVTSIGSLAFSRFRIEEIRLPDSLTSLKSFSLQALEDLNSIYLPHSIKEIGNHALSWLENIKEIIIPHSVVSIGINGISTNNKLMNISLPNSLQTIGGKAFENNNVLESIFIPRSVTKIGVGIFASSPLLKKVVVDERNKIYDSRDGANTLIDTAKNEMIAPSYATTFVPPSVTSLANETFDGINGTTYMVIPTTVVSLGDTNRAFYYVQKIVSLYYEGPSIVPMFSQSWTFSEKITIYYYSPSRPTNTGHYWHYTDNKIPEPWPTI